MIISAHRRPNSTTVSNFLMNQTGTCLQENQLVLFPNLMPFFGIASNSGNHGVWLRPCISKNSIAAKIELRRVCQLVGMPPISRIEG